MNLYYLKCGFEGRMDRVQGFARHGTPIPVLRGGGGPCSLFFFSSLLCTGGGRRKAFKGGPGVFSLFPDT